MKKLRELYDKGTQGKWYARNYTVYTHTGDGVCRVADVNTSADPDLIAAMHNRLPELLDAWETLEALRWAKQWNVQNSEPDTCHNCPLRKRCFSQETGFMYLCLHAVLFSNEWRAAYREAQKIEGVE